MTVDHHIRVLVVAVAPALAAIGAVAAQVGGDPISGGAGWVGTGLLGSVLAWLFFRHLPSKDKQIENLIVSHNVQMREQAQEYRASLIDLAVRAADQDKERRKDYRESLGVVVNHCEKEMASTGQAIQGQLGEMNRLVAALRPIVDELHRRDRGEAR